MSRSPTVRPARSPVPLRPVPLASPRPWAGGRLGDGIGERWLAGPGSLVDAGDGTRQTLDELAARLGTALVGTRGSAMLGPRFPLLVKVIDAAEWLSLQVHPSDEVAVALHGPGSLGKTEAWLVLDAVPGASLITGPRAGLAVDALRSLVGAGTMDRSDCAERPGRAGDTFLVRAGTIHAIGAGLLVYEIEQPSDRTYRIADWGRPATAARPVHTREALLAVDPGAQAMPAGTGWALDGGELRVPEFRLELVAAGDRPAVRRPAGRTPEIVTAVRGRVELAGDGWAEGLDAFDTVVVPAAVESYEIRPADGAVAAVASLP